MFSVLPIYIPAFGLPGMYDDDQSSSSSRSITIKDPEIAPQAGNVSGLQLHLNTLAANSHDQVRFRETLLNVFLFVEAVLFAMVALLLLNTKFFSGEGLFILLSYPIMEGSLIFYKWYHLKQKLNWVQRAAAYESLSRYLIRFGNEGINWEEIYHFDNDVFKSLNDLPVMMTPQALKEKATRYKWYQLPTIWVSAVAMTGAFLALWFLYF